MNWGDDPGIPGGENKGRRRQEDLRDEVARLKRLNETLRSENQEKDRKIHQINREKKDLLEKNQNLERDWCRLHLEIVALRTQLSTRYYDECPQEEGMTFSDVAGWHTI